MEGFHEVFFQSRPVGKVQIIRQGLYYRVICHCRIPPDHICRLYGLGESIRENLGVLMPEEDGFFLDKKIPVKRLGKETLRFEVSFGQASCTGEFVPICPEEPFLYIDRLKDAFLQTECGKVGIRTEKHPEAV